MEARKRSLKLRCLSFFTANGSSFPPLLSPETLSLRRDILARNHSVPSVSGSVQVVMG